MSRIIKASLIDLVIFILALTPVFIFLYYLIIVFDPMDRGRDWLHHYAGKGLLVFAWRVYIILVFCWFILRDTINLSPGKRLQKIIIVDKDTEMEASTLKKAIRNIPFLICFPLEFVMKIVDPKARLGDMIVNTKLMKVKK